LNEGDRVPADAIIISDTASASDESLLTGESLPIEKTKQSRIFAGTTIVRGHSIAVVTDIGSKTEMGKIGKTINTVTIESTNLERQINNLVKKVAWVALSLCLLVIVVHAFFQDSWLEGSLVGLSLAMAIMPNELPAVLTIFLALGAWRLSQRRVLTRKLSAVENLGAATVLCVDKTGTLTLNQMSIQKIYSEGQLIELDSQSTFLAEEFHSALEYGILASRRDPFDPMELAFVNAGMRFLEGTEHLHDDWTLKKEYPISPELLSISHAWKPKIGGGYVIGAKGAPEAIIDLCHLSPDEAKKNNQIADDLARDGLRVLGVAKAYSATSPLPIKQHDFEFNFVGLIGLIDPVRSEVPKAIEECHKAGIRVVMITGDHPTTACSIARKIGLTNPDQVLTGAAIEQATNQDLINMMKEVSVYSRIMPAQKLRLVNCLKEMGEVVAMTGDGVNDAPALKSAHIGIAMGKRGADVARESADLVLLDDDFSSIVESIRMGRRIYANLRSALIYLFAIHIPITGMAIIPVFFDYPLVLFPAHIAFLHLIIEPVSSIAYEMEPADQSIMAVPPQKMHVNLLNKEMGLTSLLMGMSILIALLVVYYISLTRGKGERDARALVFTTLIISNIVLIFMSRRPELSFVKRLKVKPTPVIKYIILSSIAMLGLVLYNEKLRDIFSFSFLHPIDLFICIITGVLSVVWTGLFPWRKASS
jgi:Ca2+-transporting ATPase